MTSVKAGRPCFKPWESNAYQTPQRTEIESGKGDFQKQRQTDVSSSIQWEVKQRFTLGQDPKVSSTVVIWRSLVKFAGLFSGKKAKGKATLAKGRREGDLQLPHYLLFQEPDLKKRQGEDENPFVRGPAKV